MRMRITISLSAVLAGFVFPASAALIDRGEGFIYDDVLDITWTQNADINGLDTWDNQVAWAASYSQTHSVYGAFDDWRLASMDVNGDGTVLDCAVVSAVDCQDNEFGHLFLYSGVSEAAPGLFLNIQEFGYWSGIEGSLGSDAWAFDFGQGFQTTVFKTNPLGAWAVRDGDIAANVIPIPAAVWLFGSALAGLGWIRRKQTA